MNQAEALEAAILARANRLAEEYRLRAQRGRDNILRESSERLHLREEREVLLAKSLAERSYRRKVQSNELKLHGEMDRLRWNLVLCALEQIGRRVQQYAEEDEHYLGFLHALLAQGVEQIEATSLVAEVNARELKRLEPQWETFLGELHGRKEIRLASEPIETAGGILIRSHDNRIRIDNTFEGRLERLRPRMQQIIVERLFPSSGETGLIPAA